MSSKLQVIKQELDKAPNLKSVMALPFVQERFVKNYEKTTGKKDGAQRFQQEVFNFMEVANENPEIVKCDKFSIFAAIVKAGTTGLSFRDGHLYPIPYKGVLKTQIGAHGKKEMLMRMPDIKRVYEAQYVLKGDSFKFDKANSRVIEHVTDFTKPKAILLDNIVAAYGRIDFTDGTSIDTLIEHDDFVKAKAAARTKAVWDAWPGEMSKKTVYNREFKLYHRYPEGEFAAFSEYDASDDLDTGADIQSEMEKKQTGTSNEEKASAPKQQDKEAASDNSISNAQIVEEDNEKNNSDEELEGAF